MGKPTVSFLITPELKKRIFQESDLQRLGEVAEVKSYLPDPVNESTLTEAIRGCEACITGWGTGQLTETILKEAPDLQIIAHSAGSVKPVVSEAVWDRKITVTSAAAAIAVGVAEFTLGLLLTGMKRVIQFNRLMVRGGWKDAGEVGKVREHYGAVIGVVGAGHVGRHLISLLSAFPVSILLADPTLSAQETKTLGAEKVSLPELMSRSDAVTLHAPSIPATKHIINKEMLSRMKKHAVLVNTARGSLIDETALIETCRGGTITAFLDVTDPEPPDADSPLRSLDNIILTPHIAGAVKENLLRQGKYTVDEIISYFQEGKTIHTVTRDMLKTMA
jgi:phosphoglycerate dehydrogenase-like enzyme